MNNLKAIVFDFDGTLVNSFPLIFAGFAHAFRWVHQREPSQAELDAMLGPTETEAIRRLSNDSDVSEQAVTAFFDFFQQHHANLCSVDPEIEALLQYLPALNLPLGIFSGRSERCLRLSTELMFGTERFSVVLGGDSVARTKPAPDGLLRAAEVLAVDVTDILYVGDTDADVALAKAVGACSVRAEWFPVIGQVLSNEDANYRFTAISDFTDFIKATFSSR